MPHFVLRNIYKPGVDARRIEVRPQHLDYVRALGSGLVLAGPLLGDDGETVTGSMLVIEMPDRAAAEAFARHDPYAIADLFETMEAAFFRKVLPA
jgi:uncharacterized protein